MRAYDLKPTNENLLKTYVENTIGRNEDLFRFVSILNSIEDGCSIALDGNWGSGKTFFVKQVKMLLDAHNSFNGCNDESRDEIISVRNHYYRGNVFALQPQVCVYYDAWENDNDNDPVMSLVYTILNSVDTDFSFKDTDWVKMGAAIMEVFSGKNWPQLIECLKGTTPLDALRDQKNVEKLVGEFLNALLPEKGNRLVVLIDELDRCKPSYAVRLLERIKHYFSHDNITFVFSININELQHTVKKHYGNDFDGTRYLDRFFDLRVSLPAPNLKRYYQHLNFDEGRFTFDLLCDTVIKEYHFELREIAKFLRLAKVAAYDPTHGVHRMSFPDGQGIQFCLCVVLPIMMGLRVQNIQRYADFIAGRDSTPLIEITHRVCETLSFGELLAAGETFDADDTQREFVALEERMNDVYSAIFATNYSGERYRTIIGKLEFSAATKDTLIRTAGLLSQFAKLDVD